VKRVLVVSYYWPPSGGPGVQRVLKFCKYLPKFGWEPVVLTVKDGEFPAIDTSLIDGLENIEVHYSSAFSFYKLYKKLVRKKSIPTHQLSGGSNDSLFTKLIRWIRFNLIIPDGRIGWYPGAVKKGIELLKNDSYDLIFSSGPPHTSHLIARKLSIKFKKKWVADFRDPWTDRFYYEESKRLRITKILDLLLEKSVLNNADILITVSDSISKLMSAYLENNKKFKIIMNGYDESDFVELVRKKNEDTISISYIGNMSKSQNPIEFFKIIDYLNQKDENKYIVNIIGSMHSDIRESIKKLGFTYFIDFHHYLPHKEAIQHMVNSEYLLLIIPNLQKNEGIITGKLFEYIRSGSTILMVGPLQSDAAKIIRGSGSGFTFEYDNLIEIKSVLRNRKIRSKLDSTIYTREYLTKSLANIFDSLYK